MTDFKYISVGMDTRAVRRGNTDLDRMATAGNKAERSISMLRAAAAALGVVLSARQAIQWADAWTAANNQIRMVSESTEELTWQQKQLMAVANDTRSSFESTATMYSRLKLSADDLNLTNEELIELSTTINKSFASNGASAAEQAGAIRQLSQGLAAGALRGDEFNSVAEQAPGIMRAIAKETGLSIGELREFAATGGITAKIIVSALKNSQREIDAAFDKSVQTLAQSLTIARNNMMEFIGNNENMQKAMAMTGKVAIAMSNNLDALDSIILAGAILMTARSIPAMTKYMQAELATIASIKAARVAHIESAAATAASAKASETMAVSSLARARANVVVMETEVAGTRAVMASILAERDLEAVRLKAQFTDKGRQLSVARMAELRTAEIAIAAQLTKQEAALAAAQQLTAATSYELAAAQAVVARAETAHTAAATRLTFAQQAMAASSKVANGAMMLFGGPGGATLIAVASVIALVNSMDSLEEHNASLRDKMDQLTESQIKQNMAIQESNIAYAKASLARAEATSRGSAAEVRSIEILKNRVAEAQKLMRDYQGTLEDLKEEEFQGWIDDMTEGMYDLGTATSESNRVTKELSETNKDHLQGLADELAMIRMSAREQAIFTALRGLDAEATKTQRDEAVRLAAAIYDANRQIKDNEISEEMRAASQERLQSLADELAMLNMTAKEQAIYTAMKQLDINATKEYRQAVLDLTIAYQDKVEAAKADAESRQTQEEIQSNLNAMADELAMLHMSGKEQAIFTAMRKLDVDATEEQRAVAAKLAGEIYEQQQAMKESTSELSEFTKQAARNMQDEFAKALGGMETNFRDSLKRIAAEYVASDIFRMFGNFLSKSEGKGGFMGGLAEIGKEMGLFDGGKGERPGKSKSKPMDEGGGGINWGGIAKTVGSFFGFFDHGGNIPTGKKGVVAEKNDEMVNLGNKGFLVPGPAKVTSSKKTAEMQRSGGVTIREVHNHFPSVRDRETADAASSSMGRRLNQQVRKYGRYV